MPRRRGEWGGRSYDAFAVIEVSRKREEVKQVRKKLFLVTVLVGLLSGMAVQAYASDPTTSTPFTFVEQEGNVPNGTEYNSDIPTASQWGADVGNGASFWSYGDAFDDVRKAEGSYRQFDDESGQEYTARSTHALDGLYDTTGNNCSTCHAVHRANGAFFLTRVDSPDDACSYCHIGDHRHSETVVYFNGDGTIYPRNGHTIGSGKAIPDSSVYQWMDDTTLNPHGDPLSGDNTTETIGVRRYSEDKNKVFKWSIDYNGDYVRTGPTFLTCMSCHQPHNAQNLVWRPNATTPNGYKLLRSNPSGSVASRAVMENYQDLTTPVDIALKAVENTLSAGNTGWALTGYTEWRGAGDNAEIAVTPGTLSVWCANCHNLQLGASGAVADNWRSKTHADRTHPVPMVDPEPIDCADCHMAAFEEGDFPHSGDASSTKLLGESYDVTTGTVDAWEPNQNKHTDMICLRCHETGINY